MRIRKFFTGDQRERVCSTCHDDVALLHDPDVSRTLKWLRACSYAGHLGLPDIVCQIDKVGATQGTRGWQQAANLLRSELRPLQYKLPTEGFSSKERSLLWGNRRALQGHTQWLVPLMISTDWDNVAQAREALRIVDSLTGDGGESLSSAAVAAAATAAPGSVEWQRCMEGRKFVSCVSTMCSHTCQGFHLQNGQDQQRMSPADALRLLSAQPVSAAKTRRTALKRSAWAYVRDLEVWKERLERNSSDDMSGSRSSTLSAMIYAMLNKISASINTHLHLLLQHSVFPFSWPSKDRVIFHRCDQKRQ